MGAPLPFAPQHLTRKQNARFWRVQLACQASLEGPLSRVFPAGAAALGGFRGPSHVPPSCSATSVQRGAVCPAPSRTGFVIALRPFPPSASRTSAAPPSAPPPRRGASPGAPRWRAPSGSPPPAGAGRLDAGAEQVRPRTRSLGPCAPPAQSGGDAPDAGGGGGGRPRLSRCWVGGKRGAPGEEPSLSVLRRCAGEANEEQKGRRVWSVGGETGGGKKVSFETRQPRCCRVPAN